MNHSRTPARRGFTQVELLLTLALLGVVFVKVQGATSLASTSTPEQTTITCRNLGGAE